MFQDIQEDMDITKAIKNGIRWRRDGNKHELYKAVEQNRLYRIRLLLQHGAKVNGSNNFVPLHLACYCNFIEIIEELLKHGANMELVTEEKKLTPLVIAIACRHVEAVSLLVKNGCKINYCSMISHQSPLHFAVLSDSFDIVKTLLEAGADTSAQGDKGYIPLHYASSIRDIRILRILLRHTSNVNAKSHNEISLLHFLMAELKTEYDYERLWLHLQFGCDVNIQDAFGNTPIHFCRTKTTLALLLLYKADADIQNVRNETARSRLDSISDLNILQCQEELSNLKREKFCCNHTVYDLLFLNSNELARFANHRYLVSTESIDNILFKFKYYNELIKVKVKKGIHRRGLMEKAIELLKTKLTVNIPEICYNEVFRYLSNNELEYFNKNMTKEFQDYEKIRKFQMKNRIALVHSAIGLLKIKLLIILPETCYHKLFRYLSSNELKHFNEAMSKIEF